MAFIGSVTGEAMHSYSVCLLYYLSFFQVEFLIKGFSTPRSWQYTQKKNASGESSDLMYCAIR